MPTYEYKCKDCAETLEVVQSFSDDALTVCPKCDGELRKVFSAAGIIFKGSGWHVKDYASKGGSSSSAPTAGDDSSSGTSESGSTGSTDSSSSDSGSKSGSKSESKSGSKKGSSSDSTTSSSAAAD